MFTPEDFNHIDKMNNSMADGIVDGSASQNMLDSVVNILSETDFDSADSRMEMMMKCINLCYEDEDGEIVLVEDNMIGVVLALCFNYANIVSNLIADGFSIHDYLKFMQEELLPKMREESTALPYWDIDNEQ